MTNRLFLKWKRSTVQKTAIKLLQPFAHAFACHNIQYGKRFPAVAILCVQAAYLRSIEFRQLKWADFIFPGDVRLSQEQLGSAAFVIHSPKNDKW